ncbi:MAG: phosphoribosylformylglycinamidine synthase subunit PurQ, partial [Planctomycetales bacterium]|nr:phosphoribosylformylglycinamidine synthase subunit PurQ [Planctomycetales bacterium]
LGICNGFQVLMKTGLFDVSAAEGPQATLAWNDCGHFIDRWVDLEVQGDKCIFLNGIHSLALPIAHAEGKFVVRDEATLRALDDAGNLVLRYAAGCNPNGSTSDVAGICDDTGRVFGLMPHPERFIDATHHPQWTRQRWSGNAAALAVDGVGLQLFRNAVLYFN